MAPTTRPQNKGKHPGILDLPGSHQDAVIPTKSQSKAKERLEHKAVIRRVAELEAELRTAQQQVRATVHEPPGPSQAKQSRTQPAQAPTSSGDHGNIINCILNVFVLIYPRGQSCC